jgi:hypothetical protein
MPRKQARGHNLKADGSKLTAYSLHTGSIPSQSAVSTPYGRSSQNSVKAKFVERHYEEIKPCMLVSVELGSDFSRGCAAQRIG